MASEGTRIHIRGEIRWDKKPAVAGMREEIAERREDEAKVGGVKRREKKEWNGKRGRSFWGA